MVKRIVPLFVVVFVYGIWAQQSTPYILTMFPRWSRHRVTLTPSDGPVLPVQAFRGNLHMSRRIQERFIMIVPPAGQKSKTITIKLTNFICKPLPTARKFIRTTFSFPGRSPSEGLFLKLPISPSMGYGLFYYVVALRTTILGKDTVLVSNEMDMAIETPTPVKNPRADGHHFRAYAYLSVAGKPRRALL